MIMMAVVVHVLMGMLTRLMAVLMAIMGMGHRLMLMLVLMFVFAMAAHQGSPPFLIFIYFSIASGNRQVRSSHACGLRASP